MRATYGSEMTENNEPDGPSDWDRARAAHWHGSAPTEETAIRDRRVHDEKSQVGSEVEES